MEPFTRDMPCPKCDRLATTVDYVPASGPREALAPGVSPGWLLVPLHSVPAEHKVTKPPQPEHLHLICDRCGYAWTMETADATVQEPDQ